MARRRGKSALGPHGIVLIDKPVGPTSRDVVNDVRKRLDLPGPGHCGTLDPLASGLLVVVAGCATRVQDRLTGHSKTYEASLILGASSATDDAEGPISSEEDPTCPGPEEVREVIQGFLGVQEQRPPIYSAIRVDGERLYKAARRGETRDIPTRTITIHDVQVISYQWPKLDLLVNCGPGTYIRSLARDLGKALGTSAYLGGLRRIRCGDFHIEEATPLSDVHQRNVQSLANSLVGWPRLEIQAQDLEPFLGGREIRLADQIEVHDDALALFGGDVIARCKKLGSHTLRMKRLIQRPEPT